jgi:hypothetical protein
VIGGSAIIVIVPDPHLVDFVIFFMGWLVGGVIWCFAYSGLIAYGRKYVTLRLFQAINVICGVFLVYFTFVLLWAKFFQ